jgi:hypothetical protein
MRSLHTQKAAGVGTPSGFQSINKIHGKYNRKPPYANRLDLPKPNRCLIVCTGSDAWHKGRDDYFFPRCKVVLPFGDDPNLYDWSIVAGSDALIFGFGDPEPLDKIVQLSALLHVHRALLVVYCPEQGRVLRIDPRRNAA